MLKYALTTVGIALLGTIAFVVTIRLAIEFSGLAYGLLKAGLIMLLIWAIDAVILKDFNTFNELKNGNIAYAIALGCFSIAVAVCIAGA